MANGVLFFIAFLWILLAVAVGFHAEGHNRTGLNWFLFVSLAGIFGVIIYLLVITSANNSSTPTDSKPLDERMAESDEEGSQSERDSSRSKDVSKTGTFRTYTMGLSWRKMLAVVGYFIAIFIATLLYTL